MPFTTTSCGRTPEPAGVQALAIIRDDPKDSRDFSVDTIRRYNRWSDEQSRIAQQLQSVVETEQRKRPEASEVELRAAISAAQLRLQQGDRAAARTRRELLHGWSDTAAILADVLAEAAR